MALLLRRGLEADRLTFTPEEGELIYVTDTKLVYVGDGITPGGILISGEGVAPVQPTYALSSNVNSVNEGESFTITLTTTNISNGTLVPYIITGVNSADIEGQSLSGNFVVNSNTSTLTITTTTDSTTEGNETLLLTLVGINPVISVSVDIVDTSTTPAIPATYALSSNVNSVNEGESFTITLTTTNISNGTLVPYIITGVNSADIEGQSLSGNFVVNSNTSTLTITTTTDENFENETLLLTLTGIIPTTSISINIVDTELSGGNPSTTIFESTIDGGNPSTTIFESTIDGGLV